MAKLVRENKALREFTFFLVAITIVGVLVCFIIKNEYTILFQLWFKRMYNKVKDFYENLSLEDKKVLYNLATRNAKVSKDKAADYLLKKGWSKENVRIALNLGAKVIKHSIRIIDKKLSNEEKK